MDARKEITTMNAKYLTLALVVAVWAGAAAEAIKYGHPESVIADKRVNAAIPRVVVSAKRTEPAIPRIVVVGRLTDALQVIAAR